MGNRLLQVTQPAELKAARLPLLEAVKATKLIGPAIRRVSTPPSAALDWMRLPYGWVDDADAFVASADARCGRR